MYPQTSQQSTLIDLMLAHKKVVLVVIATIVVVALIGYASGVGSVTVGGDTSLRISRYGDRADESRVLEPGFHILPTGTYSARSSEEPNGNSVTFTVDRFFARTEAALQSSVQRQVSRIADTSRALPVSPSATNPRSIGAGDDIDTLLAINPGDAFSDSGRAVLLPSVLQSGTVIRDDTIIGMAYTSLDEAEEVVPTEITASSLQQRQSTSSYKIEDKARIVYPATGSGNAFLVTTDTGQDTVDYFSAIDADKRTIDTGSYALGDASALVSLSGTTIAVGQGDDFAPARTDEVGTADISNFIIKAVSAADGSEQWRFSLGATNAVAMISLSPDGQRVAIQHDDRVEVYDKNGRLIFFLPQTTVTRMIWRSDDKLVTGNSLTGLTEIDLATSTSSVLYFSTKTALSDFAVLGDQIVFSAFHEADTIASAYRIEANPVTTDATNQAIETLPEDGIDYTISLLEDRIYIRNLTLQGSSGLPSVDTTTNTAADDFLREKISDLGRYRIIRS